MRTRRSRNWAVFGLGVQGDADSPAIQEALLRCPDDTNEEVREEAAGRLGKNDQDLDESSATLQWRCSTNPYSRFEWLKQRQRYWDWDEDPPEWRRRTSKQRLPVNLRISD